MWDREWMREGEKEYEKKSERNRRGSEIKISEREWCEGENSQEIRGNCN